MILAVEQQISAGSQFDGTNGGAVGTVVTVAGSALVAGESFFLSDGFTEVEYVFSAAFTSIAETSSRRAVLFTAADTADQVRDSIVRAVNRTPAFDLIASAGAAATVDLVNRHPGHVGNVVPTADLVADAGFVVSQMAGGVLEPKFHDVDGVRYMSPASFGGVLELPFGVPSQNQGVRSLSIGEWILDRVVADLTTATSYTLDLEIPGSPSVSMSSGAGGVILLSDLGRIMAGERVVLKTVGATGALMARMSGRPLVML